MEICHECFVGNGHILSLCFSVRTKHSSHFSIFSRAKLCVMLGLARVTGSPQSSVVERMAQLQVLKKNISIKKKKTKKIRSRYIQQAPPDNAKHDNNNCVLSNFCTKRKQPVPVWLCVCVHVCVRACVCVCACVRCVFCLFAFLFFCNLTLKMITSTLSTQCTSVWHLKK